MTIWNSWTARRIGVMVGASLISIAAAQGAPAHGGASPIHAGPFVVQNAPLPHISARSVLTQSVGSIANVARENRGALQQMHLQMNVNSVKAHVKASSSTPATSTVKIANAVEAVTAPVHATAMLTAAPAKSLALPSASTASSIDNGRSTSPKSHDGDWQNKVLATPFVVGTTSTIAVAAAYTAPFAAAYGLIKDKSVKSAVHDVKAVASKAYHAVSSILSSLW